MKNFVASIAAVALVALALPKQGAAQVLTPADNGIIPDPPKSYHHNMVFPYPHLREADLMWSTRHWERINVKHKANFHLYYPIQAYPGRKSLYDVLVDGILEENTIVEVFANDNFEIPLTPDQVYNYVNMIDTIRDPDDPTQIVLIDTISITSKDVIAWEIKSDWFFDKQRGEMKNRIIGLSPVVRNPSTEEKYNLFWVWFPDARYALATHQAYNTKNRSMRLTYDQVFHLRYFDSVIFKEDNVYDRSIEEYKRNSNLDQLLEAQRIKNNLRSFESELWEY
jgi:gliding motility associated protien GldN